MYDKIITAVRKTVVNAAKFVYYCGRKVAEEFILEALESPQLKTFRKNPKHVIHQHIAQVKESSAMSTALAMRAYNKLIDMYNCNVVGDDCSEQDELCDLHKEPIRDLALAGT